MNCHTDKCSGMEAGTPARSWGYVRRRGLHDLSCEAAEDKCDGGCGLTHRMMRGYRVGRRGQRVEDIMHEVMTQGPVLALMEVTRDLFSYKEGVYRRLEAEVVGHLAVRIVGWGEEAGVKYWRLANTWGRGWGEGGLFRIGQWVSHVTLIQSRHVTVRGSNHCRIEEMVTAAWPRDQRGRGSRRRRRQRRRGRQ